MIKKIKILFIGSNPSDQTRIRIDKELREIDTNLRLSKQRENFELIKSCATRSRDLLQVMLDYEPEIVHFSGHSTQMGICLEDDSDNTRIVSNDALTDLFKQFSDKVQCIVLNSCYSKEQASVLSEHINYVVGMQDSISDNTALEYAIGFYMALGSGKDYRYAHTTGLTNIKLAGLTGSDSPLLLEKNTDETNSEIKEDVPFFEMISDGEFKGKNGKYKLTNTPTVFFYYRLIKAFPGVRGLEWFKGETAVKRLKLLLREPTKFDIADGNGLLFTDPIFWFRGNAEFQIEKFSLLSPKKCLLNNWELKITKVAAYNSSAYYRCFVYVEVEGEQPIGLYNYTKEQIENVTKWKGYYNEEYGLLNEIPISIDEYDDGAAEINGEIVNILSSEYRVRFLTSYNFIIAAKSSAFNSSEGNLLLEEYMNDILKGGKTLEEFAKKAEKLEKNSRMDI